MKLKGGIIFGLLVVMFLSSCATQTNFDVDSEDTTTTTDSGDEVEDTYQDTGSTDDSGNYEVQQETTPPTVDEEMGEGTDCEWCILWETLTGLSQEEASDEEIFAAMCLIGCEELNPENEQDCSNLNLD